MEIFIKASQFILSLSILIVLHELGHYIPAKLFKIKVEKFYLFFDYKFSLLKKKIGDTVYGIGWIPLGGYVKIAGMMDESMDKEQLKQPAKPWEFRAKPAWQRLIVMLGGVFVNFVLGFAIYSMLFFVWGHETVKPNDVKYGFEINPIFHQYGFKNGDKILKVNNKEPENVLKVGTHLFLRNISTVTVQHLDGNIETLDIPENIGHEMFQNDVFNPFTPRYLSKIDTVLPNTPAATAGLQKNDVITAINSHQIAYWNDIKQAVLTLENKEAQVTVNRNGSPLTLSITPENNVLGIAPSHHDAVAFNKESYGVFESLNKGTYKAYNTLQDFIAQFKYVFTAKGAQSIGGFIAIGNVFPPSWDWYTFWTMTAFLSIMLGFMNLLPIPALDGGHALFTLYEMVTKRKPSDKFMEYAQVTGFVILIALLIFANGNDVVKLLN